MKKRKQNLLLLFIFLSTILASFAQQPLNLDFEKQSFEGPNRPWGWSSYYVGSEAHSSMDSLNPRTGRYAFKVTNKADAPYSIGYWVAPRMLRGETIKLTAWVKHSSQNGKAWLEANTWGDLGQLDAVSTKRAKADSNWQKLEATIKIDSAAYTLLIQIYFSGKGEALFDDLSIEINGAVITDVPLATAIQEKELAIIGKHSYPFQNTKVVDDESPARFKDLEAFGALVKDAKIIGLGECTHGTSEFFSMKHRILEYAVYQLGTRVFAFEDNQLGVENINDYVLHGKGEIAQLFKYLFGVWNTEEVRNLIQWVRNYNINHPNDKVEFVGFDAQNPNLPIKSIAKTLSELEPELKTKIDALHKDYYDAWQKSQYPRSDSLTMKGWYDNAIKAEQLIVKHSKKWLESSTTDKAKNDITWLRQNARSVSNAALVYTGDVAIRDKYMAENISWIMDQKQPKGPIVVWAHDVHINHGHGPDDLFNYFGGESMGAFLRKDYGDAYKAFGFFTYEGSYASYLNGQAFEAPAIPAPKGSIDEALHRLAKKQNAHNYILDLTWASKNPYDYFWMIEPRPVRFATYFAFDYGYETMVSLPFQFDGIIFIDQTKAAVKLK